MLKTLVILLAVVAAASGLHATVETLHATVETDGSSRRLTTRAPTRD